MSPILQICCLLSEPSHHSLIGQILAGDRFNITSFNTIEQVSKNLIEEQSNQDCLIIWLGDEIGSPRVSDLGICLPTVVILSPHSFWSKSYLDSQNNPENKLEPIYPATVTLGIENLIELPETIDKAIALFLKIPTKLPNQVSEQYADIATAQQRLSKKLQERLGYLGVYYKRDPTQFWRRLSDQEKTAYIKRLAEIYRLVILEYFKDKSKQLNTLIDEFASMCFFADISVSQVLQIHMELMENFAVQLRLEGRNEEILLDYRITLIDMIAHLCEMYRRSIPKDMHK